MTTKRTTPSLASRLHAADRRASAGYVAKSVKQSFNRAARAYLRQFLAFWAALDQIDQDETRVSYNPGGIAVRGEVSCVIKFKGVDLGVYICIGSSVMGCGGDAGYWRFSIPSRDVYGTGAATLHRNRWIDSKTEPTELALEVFDALSKVLNSEQFAVVKSAARA